MTASATLRVPAGWGQASRLVCCARQEWQADGMPTFRFALEQGKEPGSNRLWGNTEGFAPRRLSGDEPPTPKAPEAWPLRGG
jgi:hypothetical protein